MAAVYESPWGDLWTQFAQAPIPSRKMRERMSIGGTSPDRVQPISWYLDMIEEAEVECRRHRRLKHKIFIEVDHVRALAAEAKRTGRKVVRGLHTTELDIG